MGLIHGFDANQTLVPLLLAADGSIIAAAKLYNAAGVAIQTDAAGDLIVAGKDGAGTARILRTDANGQPMISAIDESGVVRQIRTATNGTLTVSGRDVAGNGYTLRTDNTGELSVLGHLLNRIFAYDGFVNLHAENLNPGAGTVALSTTDVPAGKLAHFTIAAARDRTTAATALTLTFTNGTLTQAAITFAAVPVNTQMVWNGNFYAPEGWHLTATFTGVTAGDDLFLDLSGYYMDV